MKRNALKEKSFVCCDTNKKTGRFLLAACLTASLMSAVHADSTYYIPTPTRGANAAYSLKDTAGGETGANTTMPVNEYEVEDIQGNQWIDTTPTTKYLDIKKSTYSDGRIQYTFNEMHVPSIDVEYTTGEGDNIDRSSGTVSNQTIINPSSPKNYFMNAGREAYVMSEETVDIKGDNGRRLLYENYVTNGTLSNNTEQNVSAEMRGNLLNYGNLSIEADFVNNSVNTEIQEPSINAEVFAYGGAIYSNGNITKATCDFINNSATTSGGAVYNLLDIGSMNGNFIKNRAINGSGGAIYSGQNGNIKSIEGAFISNTAAQTGGAIYNNGIISAISADFISNAAQSGSAIYNGENGSISSITGDFISNDNATIDNYNGTIGSINSNFINDKNGAIRNAGGTIDTISGNFISSSGLNTNVYSGTISNTGDIKSIKGNFLNGTNYNEIYNNKNIQTIDAGFYNKSGVSAIFNDSNGYIKSISGTFDTNSNDSGAIYNRGRIESIKGNFYKNQSDVGGGVIWNLGTGTIDKIVGSFEGNKNTSGGGAIDNTGTIGTIGDGNTSSFYVKDYFLSNHSNANGGAIENDGQISDIKTLFYDNSASHVDDYGVDSDEGDEYHGGAIYNDTNGKITNVNSNFDINKAQRHGGGIYNAGEITNLHSDFSGNTADDCGGGIYNSGKITSVKGNFTSNEAVGNGHGSEHASTYIGSGGGIYNTADGKITTINSKFESNVAEKYGGAIFNEGEIASVKGEFTDNVGSYKGGAIYNRGTLGSAEATAPAIEANFKGNRSGEGGAILNASNSTIYGIKGNFENNKAEIITGETVAGGAISNQGTITYINGNFKSNSTLRDGGAINNSSGLISTKGNFSNNTAQNNGGAIYNKGTMGLIDVDNPAIVGNFTNNVAKVGGAIYNDSNSTIYGIKGDFIGNESTAPVEDTDGGGAIHNKRSITYIKGNFTGNKANSYGGAIHNAETADIESIVGNFKSNSSLKDGGAIYNNGPIESIKGNFDSNTAQLQGGGIYNYDNIGTIEGDFTNNSAEKGGSAIYNEGIIDSIKGNFTKNTGKKAGAIYNEYGYIYSLTGNFLNNTITDSEKGGAITNENGVINLNAQDQDMLFKGNTADGKPIAVYNEAYGDEDAIINMNTGKNKSIVFNDKITGSDEYDINKNKLNINNPAINAQAHTGTVAFNNTVSNQTITLYDGTMKLGKDGNIDGDNLIIKGGTIDMINKKAGTATLNQITIDNDANLKIDVDYKNNKTDRLTADNYGDLNGNLHVTELNVLSDPKDGKININIADDELKDHIILESVTLNKNIMSPIATYKANYNSETGNLGLKRTGFNPAVLASPIAAQLGGYLNQLNSYESAFNNLDMRMNYDRKTRSAFKYANKYAYSGNTTVYSPTYLQETNAGIWFKPYISYESVGLKNGPKVDNALYGSYFGGDSPVYSFNSGVDMQYSVYAGYTGSHQSYTDTGIYQNGGILGATALLYKDDFFTALTLNAGLSGADANTKYGNETFGMFSTGVASKTGYNWELADGKFIIQPSFLVSYTFVNAFNYTNSAGVKIDSDPIHAINISPGLKFIGNFGNGWQPYIGARMVWNILDKAEFQANDVALPSMSIKPYVQYGVGIQKLWGERSTGFLQCMLRSGGRNGVAFNVGYRYALGK